MKQIIRLVVIMILATLLMSCRSIYRVYDDQELEVLVLEDFGFSEMLFFKIVDADTAKELTGKSYNLSGVTVGTKDEKDIMVFIPKKVSEQPFIIENPFEFDISSIYKDLRLLKDTRGNLLYNDPSNDYGGLSIETSVYNSIKNKNMDLVFDSKIFFVISTDQVSFYVGFVSGNHIIFDGSYQRISQ